MTTGLNPNDVIRARQAIIEAARQLVAGNVLSRSLHGNISVRLPGTDQFLLTGSTLKDIGPDDLARLDLYGHVLDGSMDAASREIVQMHAAVYRRRPDVGAVIHTHSPHATAFAIANRPIPPAYEALVRFDFTAPIPVAAYGPRGSERSVSNIVDVITDDTKVVLLANHGLLAFDQDVTRAVQSVFVLEEAAELIALAEVVGGARPIPEALIEETRQRRDAFAG